MTVFPSTPNGRPILASVIAPGWRLALTFIGIAAVIFGIIFWSDIRGAVRVWIASTAYNHCFLILPLVGFLLWERRVVIAAVSPHPSFWPLVLMPVLSALWLIAAVLDIQEGRQLLVVTMFGQARLNPSNPDPSQKMQQRMMQYGMPLMFGVMSFFFPSGLSLYILTNTCLSALHSIYMNKYDKKNLALAAQLKKNQATAAAAKDSAAVKAAKDANPAPSDVEQARTKKTEPDGDRADRQLEAKPRVRTSQRRKKGGRR